MNVERLMRQRPCRTWQRYVSFRKNVAMEQNHRISQLAGRRQLALSSRWKNETSMQDGVSMGPYRQTIGSPRQLCRQQHSYFSSTASNTADTVSHQTEKESTIHQQNEQEPSLLITIGNSVGEPSSATIASSDDQTVTKNESVTPANRPQIQSRNMPLSSSSSTINARKPPVDATNIFERAAELCNETMYPISAFADKKGNYRHFMMVFRAVIAEAQRLVQSKYPLSKNFSSGNEIVVHHEGLISDTINLAFQLLRRICQEPWKSPNQNVPLQRFYKPQYTNMLLQVWNFAALRNESKLPCAYDVTQLVKLISYKHLYSHNHAEQPRYDPTAIAMILQVAIHEARDILAPSMERQLMFTEQATEPQESKNYPSPVSHSMPNKPSPKSPKELLVYLYNTLMKAHAESNNKHIDKTIKIMYDIMEEMRVKYFIKPNTITYNILLRFLRLSSNSSSESFQLAFQKMQLEQVSPNVSTYNEVIEYYTTDQNGNQQKLDIAEQYIKQMIALILMVGPVRDDDGSISHDARQQYYSDISRITNSAQRLMDAHAREFMKQPSSQRRQEIISRAKGLFQLLDKNNIFSGTSTQELLRTIMDMYAQCGNLAAAKTILNEIVNPSVPLYVFMIKAYGEADRIDDSIDVFNSMLDDQRVTPNMFAFNVLLNACAISKSLGHLAYDRATELVSLLSTNERCVQLQLQPDKVTYNTLLKCLTKSSTCKQGASIIAENIILEMEERQKTDDQIKPNMVTFNLAITVCLQVNDQERVNAFMNKMEQYSLKVDTRLCNLILNHYAQTGTFESAERAESFLSNLKIMGQADKSVGPNVFTYNIILNAWGRSDHPNFAHRMMSIYESMLSDRVTPDAITYNTLVFHLSKEPNSVGLADKLLQDLENSNNDNITKYQPGSDIYALLIKAYIKFRDAENATRLLFRWFGVVRVNPAVSKERNLVVESMTPLYHRLMQLWIQLGDLERATSVTEKIHDLYLDGNREPTTFVGREKHRSNSPEPPSLKTYKLLYEAWSKSGHQSKEMYLTKIKARIESYQQ